MARSWERLVVLCEHIAEPHFDIAETADLLGLKRQSVEYWVSTRKLAVRWIEGKNYVRLVDVERILYEGTASPKCAQKKRENEAEKAIKLQAKYGGSKRKSSCQASIHRAPESP